MALNIKDPEVDRLAAELAARWDTTKTDAIRRALNLQLSSMQTRRTDQDDARCRRCCAPRSGPCSTIVGPCRRANARKFSAIRPAPGVTPVIVDASALIALIEDEEPYSPAVINAIAAHRAVRMGAPSIAECLIVLTARHGPAGRTVFERLRSEIGLGTVDFTAEHAIAAQRAFARYGRAGTALP